MAANNGATRRATIAHRRADIARASCLARRVAAVPRDGLRFFVHAGVDLEVPLHEQDPSDAVDARAFLSRSDEVDCAASSCTAIPAEERQLTSAASAQPRYRAVMAVR